MLFEVGIFKFGIWMQLKFFGWSYVAYHFLVTISDLIFRFFVSGAYLLLLQITFLKCVLC